jgi:hypothetical protein
LAIEKPMTHITKDRKKEKKSRYAEKAKAMWQLINKEAGNFPSYDKKI